MENEEEILLALDEFNQYPNAQISPLLEEYLKYIARSGCTIFSWKKLKCLFVRKLTDVIVDFHNESPTDHMRSYPNVENVNFEEMKSRILDAIEQFNGIPFTIQRLCELITCPKKHYKASDKFLRGLEKNLMVVTTIDPLGNKIYNEMKIEENPVFNGVRPQSPVFSSPAPTSFLSWHPNSPASPYTSAAYPKSTTSSTTTTEESDQSSNRSSKNFTRNPMDIDRLSNVENISDPATAHLSDEEVNKENAASKENKNNENFETASVEFNTQSDTDHTEKESDTLAKESTGDEQNNDSAKNTSVDSQSNPATKNTAEVENSTEKMDSVESENNSENLSDLQNKSDNDTKCESDDAPSGSSSSEGDSSSGFDPSLEDASQISEENASKESEENGQITEQNKEA
ncbi:DgyrCDS13179 [Dimorphilus gyrociliatus]|uniref:DgyrCDS13179 n=1 Tax=Dimorphilus gyrociliatus TaxID=2664684 RepID=A0A7I8WA12_9ANNE|nr:DgyrCDS13179 [Dimorphilus gyrociliatus]